MVFALVAIPGLFSCGGTLTTDMAGKAIGTCIDDDTIGTLELPNSH